MRTVISMVHLGQQTAVVWIDGQLFGDPQVIELLEKYNEILEEAGLPEGPHTARGHHLESVHSVIDILRQSVEDIVITGDMPDTYQTTDGGIN